jgi:hypothetical protein
MAIATLDTLYTQAVSAIDAGDYDAAIQIALKAKLRLATTPDITRSLGAGSNQSVVWANAGEIEGFIRTAKQLQASARAAVSGPMRSTKIRYRRAGDAGGCE